MLLPRPARRGAESRSATTEITGGAGMGVRAWQYIQRHHVGLLALFFGLGGSAYAATLPRNSVGTAQLRRGAVTSTKVRNASLRRRDFAPGQLPRGARGP